MNRKEIFKKEIETGATITEIKVYTNSLRLILAALSGRDYVRTDINGGRLVFTKDGFLSKEEQEKLSAEIKDLDKKIKLYERVAKNGKIC